METIAFSIPGEPKAQPRVRAFARKIGGKYVARVYDPGTAEGWKSAIAEAARPHIPDKPMEGPVVLDVMFYFSRPKRLMTKRSADGPIAHTSKPDRDNLEKALLDCLTKLGFFLDDSQVYRGQVQKWYVPKGGYPMTTVSMWEEK